MAAFAKRGEQQTRSAPVIAPRKTPATNVASLQPRCDTCNLRERCLPCGSAAGANQLIYKRRRVDRGDRLYRAGEPFVSLYALRRGFFKTTLTLSDGRDQVAAFHMSGEMLGMDGIATGSHGTGAIALEDSEVCVIPYARLQELTRDNPALQVEFHKMMSREITREHGVMMLLGSMRAEERLAAFLLNLAQRFEARGFSKCEFHLCMTRDEIGSYLGLKLETVSRTFSKFQEQELIGVRQKHVRIIDAAGLRKAMGRR